MKIIAGTLFIILITLVGSRKTFTKISLYIKEHHFFLTGTEFILIGYILGKNVFNFLETETINSLYPFLGLGLGWIGLIYGLQFNLKSLIRFPMIYFISSGFQSIFTIVIVFIFSSFFIQIFSPEYTNILFTVLILAASASCSSSSIPALLSYEHKFRGSKSLRIIRYISSTGDLIGVILIGFAFVLFQKGNVFDFFIPAAIQWLFIAIVIGVITGVIYVHIISKAPSDQELLLITMGLVLFSGGLSLYLELSPIFSNLIAGIIIANYSKNWHKIEHLTIKAEKTIYLILLIIAGAMWDFGSVYAVTFALIYFLIRLCGKLFSGIFISKTFFSLENIPSFIGLGLTCQSGMAAAMLINFQIFAQTELDKIIVSTIIISIILNDLICPGFTDWMLEREKK